jgi:two-component sensor histidine kinase
MAIENFMYSTMSSRKAARAHSEFRAAAEYECELINDRCPVTQLREALAREEALILQKDELIQQQEALRRESDHRLLNGMQMIVSLLSLQSRAATHPEAASQLAVAANRVATIERVHRRLHYLDGVQTVAFKQYLVDLCRDFSTMLSSDEHPEQTIAVEGIEVSLPTTTATPLGFIVNELITNAAKYGIGHITVALERNSEKGYALSVSNDGPVLPEGYDPAASKGLGMKIIRSFLGRIGGELRFGPADGNQGARFTVLFS